MTLIELLIVLGLMAAIASVALTTLDSMGDRTRMDTTRNRLDMIERAIVGDGLEPGRFISDMGRLPVVHLYPDPSGSNQIGEGQGLIELWDDLERRYIGPVPTADILGFEPGAGGIESIFTNSMCSDLAGGGTPQPPSDPTGMTALFGTGVEVNTLGGWSGPYLQIGGNKLFDGFGNAFAITQRKPPLDPELQTGSFTPPVVWEKVDDAAILAIDERTPAQSPGIYSSAELTGIASYGREPVGDWTTSDDPDPWEEQDAFRFVGGDKSKATLVVTFRAKSSYPSSGAWVSPAPRSTSISTWTKLDGSSNPQPYAQSQIVRAGPQTPSSGPPYDVDHSHGSQADDLFICTNVSGTGASNTSIVWSRTGIVDNNYDPVAPTDGATWQYLPSCEYMNRMRVVLFMPYADPNYDVSSLPPLRMRVVTAWSEHNAGVWTQECADSESSSTTGVGGYCLEPINPNATGFDPTTDWDSRRVIYEWTDLHSATLHNLPPGIRRFYAYGYYEDGSNILNAHSSGLQTIELKPGVNHITVYLNEPL